MDITKSQSCTVESGKKSSIHTKLRPSGRPPYTQLSSPSTRRFSIIPTLSCLALFNRAYTLSCLALFSLAPLMSLERSPTVPQSAPLLHFSTCGDVPGISNGKSKLASMMAMKIHQPNNVVTKADAPPATCRL